VPRSVSVVPVEPSPGMVRDVPCLSRISTRCHCSRANRNSGARSKDQNSIHHLAPFVVPPALLVTKITARARTGFRGVPVTDGGTGTRPTPVISLGTGSEGERQAGNDLGPKFRSVGLIIRADAEGLANLRTCRDCQMNLLPSPATTYSQVRPCLPILPGARACAKAPASMPGLSPDRSLAIPGAAFRPGRASAARATRPELVSFIREAGLLQPQGVSTLRSTVVGLAVDSAKGFALGARPAVATRHPPCHVPPCHVPRPRRTPTVAP